MPTTHTDERGVLGDMLFRQRKALSLTMWQVADRAGLSQPYISRLESGARRQLTHETATRIAHAYQLDPVRVHQAAGIITAEQRRELSKRNPVVEALLADPHLTNHNKRIVISTYMALAPYARVKEADLASLDD